MRTLLVVNPVAQRRDHWAVLERACERRGVVAHVVGGPIDGTPDVHREGWAVEPAPGSPIVLERPLAGSRIARVSQLRRTARGLRPAAVLVGGEPHDRAALAALASLPALGRPRVVALAHENRVTLPTGWKGAAIRTLWRRIDALAAGSTSALDSYRDAGFPERPAETLVAAVESPPAGVAPLALPFSPRPPLVVGFAGRLVPEKGLRALFDAVAETPGVALAVAGDGPLAAELAARAREPGLEGRVVLLGLLERAALWRFYRAIDCLALPSLTTRGWSEQFGYVAGEAMACGRPVVGSSSGAIPEVLGDAGVVVPEGDAPALAAALARLRDDPAGRGALGEAAERRYRERFTIDRCAETLGRLLLDGDGLVPC